MMNSQRASERAKSLWSVEWNFTAREEIWLRCGEDQITPSYDFMHGSTERYEWSLRQTVVGGRFNVNRLGEGIDHFSEAVDVNGVLHQETEIRLHPQSLHGHFPIHGTVPSGW